MIMGYLGLVILELIANVSSFFNPFEQMEYPIKFDIAMSRFSIVCKEGPQVIISKNVNIIFLSLKIDFASCLSFVCLIVCALLSHWYPESDVVLDCIDS